MSLNCKQGDLAIIVSSACGNEGKIVRCLELLHTDRVTDTNGETWRFAGGPRWVWRIDRSINFGNKFDVVQTMHCSDHKMRPLRGDITDEEIETADENKRTQMSNS